MACLLMGTCCRPDVPDLRAYRVRRAARRCPHPGGNRWAGLKDDGECDAACAACEHSIRIEVPVAGPVGGNAATARMLRHLGVCAECESYAGGERPCGELADRAAWQRALAAEADGCPRGLFAGVV